MRRYILFFICSILLVGAFNEVLARRSGGSSFSRSSSRSYSRPASKPSTSSRKSSSVISKKKSNLSSKPKARTNSKLTKAVKKKNAESNKKYSKYGKDARKQAAIDFKKSNEWKSTSQDLAKKNKFDSPNPPSTRPEHIPQNVTVNGSPYPTTYGMLPGGSYGYGYMDPTGVMIALAAHDMMVTNSMLRTNGYGTYGSNGTVVVQRASHVGLVISCIAILLVIAIILVVVVKSSRY